MQVFVIVFVPLTIQYNNYSHSFYILSTLEVIFCMAGGCDLNIYCRFWYFRGPGTNPLSMLRDNRSWFSFVGVCQQAYYIKLLILQQTVALVQAFGFLQGLRRD